MAPNTLRFEVDGIASTHGKDHLHGLPVDPDIADPVEPPTLGPPTHHVPHLPPGVLLAIFVGGILGGLARYGIGRAWPPHTNGFPWDIFTINIVGAFALAVLLVLVMELRPHTPYVRPALGTGFIGAFTTFSSLATATDQLLAHGHPGLAIAYAGGSLFGGVAAAGFGLFAARSLTALRHRVPTVVASR
jgi:CrcB protein